MNLHQKNHVSEANVNPTNPEQDSRFCLANQIAYGNIAADILGLKFKYWHFGIGEELQFPAPTFFRVTRKKNIYIFF